jgi:hypothetical protein
MTTNPYPIPQSNRNLAIFAWVVTILISVLPDIIWIEFSKTLPIGLVKVKMGLLLLLILVAMIWKPLRPLRSFFIVMLAFFSLSELRLKINFTWPALQDLFGGSEFDTRMQAEQTGKLAVSLAVIAVLFLLGFKRHDCFLVRGCLKTPIEPVRWLGFPKPTPWPSFGLQWSFYIATALAVILYLGQRPDPPLLLKVLPIIPSILFYAGLNAFNEEITYRVPILTTLETVSGSLQALWMSAYFFGIAHYFGTPGGIIGGILSIFMGWILGKAMVETRGLFWSWWIHFLSDVAIFTFLALSLLK